MSNYPQYAGFMPSGYGAGVPVPDVYGCGCAPPAFGQDAGGSGAAGAGGAGAAAAGAIAQGIGMGISAVAGGIGAAVDQQNRPDIVAKEQTLRFVGAMVSWDRLEEELSRAQARYDAAVRWLRSPYNRADWAGGAAAKAVAPPARKLCPPLYPRHPDFPPGGELPNPGGHVQGDPGCRCPTHKCAYKPSVRAQVDAKQAEAALMERAIWRIQNAREVGGSYKDGLTPQTGNILGAKREATQAWSLLMSLDAMSPLFAAAGMMSAWRPPDLTSPRTLQRLFPDDPDAKAGRVPADVGDRAIAMGLSMYGMGLFPASYTMPLWVYGFTPQEARSIGIGPTIAQVATVQAQRSPARMAGAFGGYSFGSSSLRDELRGLVASGQARSIPPSPPQAVDPSLIAQTEGAAAQGRRLDGFWSRIPTWGKILIGLGAFALVGGLFWLIL